MISYHWPNTTTFNQTRKDNNGICLSFLYTKKYIQGEQENSVRPDIHKIYVWQYGVRHYIFIWFPSAHFIPFSGPGPRLWNLLFVRLSWEEGTGWRATCSGILYFVCHINLILSLCFNYLDGIQGLINRHSSFNLLTQ